MIDEYLTSWTFNIGLVFNDCDHFIIRINDCHGCCLTISQKQLVAWHNMEHHKSRLEIDKLFIEYPDLWSIYDNHPVTKQIELSIQQQVRKDALAQYHLHLYKTVYEFYNEHLIKSRQDRKAWKIWVQYIEHDLERSSHIRETAKKSYRVYDKKLVKFYKNIIRRIESKPVNQIDEH